MSRTGSKVDSLIRVSKYSRAKTDPIEKSPRQIITMNDLTSGSFVKGINRSQTPDLISEISSSSSSSDQEVHEADDKA